MDTDFLHPHLYRLPVGGMGVIGYSADELHTERVVDVVLLS